MILIFTVSKKDFTNYGCVVIVVMTHGGDNGLLMAKDEAYYEQDILNYFKHKEKPTLVTKPVILIIQVRAAFIANGQPTSSLADTSQ